MSITNPFGSREQVTRQGETSPGLKFLAIIAAILGLVALGLTVFGHGLEAVPVAIVALVAVQLEQGSS